MKALLPAAIGILLLIILGLLLHERGHSRELRASLATIGDDRDRLATQVQQLEQAVAEVRARQSTSSVRAPAPAARNDSSATTQPAAEPPPTPGVTTKAPAGWHKNGSKPDAYVVGVDQNQTWGGMPSAYVKSIDPSVNGFGGMMQTASAENFIGKRVRLSGWIKTEDANEGGQLWLRVDGQQSGQMLQFDNMNNRAVKGTRDWEEASIVLDVPENARALAYGFFVKGAGTVWVSGTTIQEVGTEVPSTNMMTQPRELPKAPVNLGFYPDAKK